MTVEDLPDPVGKVDMSRNRAKPKDKLALGIGAVVAMCVATGIIIAKKSGKAMRQHLKKRARK